LTTLPRRAELAVWVGLSGIGLGAAAVLVYAWVEFLNNPGLSLVDAYWVGRAPWVPAGILLALAGSAVALPAGAALVLLRGDWVRWFLILPLAGAELLWWAIALGLVAFAGYEPIDPIGFAYRVPQTAAILLVVPPVAMAVLAFLPTRRDGPVRLGRVHPPEPVYRYPMSDSETDE
jgi:hypothetical protein